MHSGEPGDAVGEIVRLLRAVLHLPPAALTAQTRLDALGLDSLDLVEAGLELEAMVGRELPEGALADARTVSDVARLFAEPAT
jgi:acyl carrier protein